jgi:hypothetical protein
VERLLTFETDGFVFKGTPFTPKIYDSLTLEKIPESFNAVKILVEGGVDADLDFKEPKRLAEKAIEKGLFILWQIDLGLFHQFRTGLNSESQYRALQKSLEVFIEEVYTPFFDKSLGVILFQGSSSFHREFPWSYPPFALLTSETLKEWLKQEFSTVEMFCKKCFVDIDTFETIDHEFMQQKEETKHLLNLFCRDLTVDYLNLLTGPISETIPLFLLIECEKEPPVFLAELLAKNRFQNYVLATKGGALPIQGLAFQDERDSFGFISSEEFLFRKKRAAKIGFCLPEHFDDFKVRETVNEVFLTLNGSQIDYRVIPEADLISDWQGLDSLIVFSKTVTKEGLRALKGFQASLGQVITVGDPLGLTEEISFKKWVELL